MEEKKNLYDILKNNKSLEPIARLAELAVIVKNVILEADKVGNKLSVFACQSETVVEDIPPIEAWMDLCDYYKNCARDFSNTLTEALEVSHVTEIPKRLEEYTHDVIDKTITTLENDEELRREIFGDDEED